MDYENSFESAQPQYEEKKIINVPIDMLAESVGTTANDIIGKNGVVILPAGVDLRVIEGSLDSLIEKLKRHNVTSIQITAPNKLSDKEIESIIDNVYSENEQLISKDKTRSIIKNIDTLFQMTSRDERISPEVMSGIHSMSEELSLDIMSNPSAILSLAKVREADEYTFVHSFNVSVLTGFLGSRLYPGNKEFVNTLVHGGILHDIGKAYIPPEVLQKPGRLTQEEFAIMKGHPELGVNLARKSGVTDERVISIIGGHHEKFDGNGYPTGKKGSEIHEFARIAAVADVFDALTARRVYKEPMSSRDAINIIINDTGKFFDPKVAREMLLIIGLYPPGSIVSLSDGRVGIVVSGGGHDLVRPLILLRNSGRSEAYTEPVFLNLKETDLHIVKYIGYGGKRNLETPQ